MAEIVNLHLARKRKLEQEHEKEADANRIRHGESKAARKLRKSRVKAEAARLEAHKRET